MAVMASTTGETGHADVEVLARQAQEVLDALGSSIDWEVSLLLCDDAFIRPLNQQWRGKDSATDVLSFPQLEVAVPGHPPVDQGTLLGDIIVSVPTAERQADALGHGLGDELAVLLVHGLCHLLGYDHLTDEQRVVMQAREHTLLKAVGLDRPSLIERVHD